MKTSAAALMLSMLAMADARPDVTKVYRNSRMPLRSSAKFRREVPQEHSHEQFLTGVEDALNLNNVDNVQAAVFALLGNAAAAEGAGQVQDLDCLQQRIADQAFTNAKEANDVTGMTNALIFRTLERNTAAVGDASALCESETATNPEIAALTQHQDPASQGAAATNKQIALDLAVQLDSIGADPQMALLSGTFAPGEIGDPTAAGNTCNVLDDAVGCIETQNLRVNDATPQEINAAVAAAGNGNANGNGNGAAAGNGAVADGCAAVGNNNEAATPATPVALASPSATPAAGGNNNDNADNNNAGAGDANGNDINAFAGSLGADPIPIAQQADGTFEVNGSVFQNQGAAAQRACDVQKNACANEFNSGGQVAGGVAACDAQQQECTAANGI